jgi:hypothetical protein
MKRLLVATGALALAGCVSTLTVTKTSTDADAGGIRYALPKTMLAVEPDPAGKTDYTVELISLPDPSREYAIAAKTFLGKYDLDVKLYDGGLLESIQFAPDDTAVASTALDTAAALVTKRTEMEAVAEKDASTKQQALLKAVDDAELALQQARLDLEAAEAIHAETPEKDQPAARAAVLKAEAEVAKKAAALAAAKDALGEFESRNAGLLAKPGAATSAGGTGGPMFFEIVDTVDPAKCSSAKDCEGTIEIKAVNWRGPGADPVKQQALEAFAKPKSDPPKAAPKPASNVLVYPNSSNASFWYVRVLFDDELPLSGKLIQLIWRPHQNSAADSPVAAGCSTSFTELPKDATKDVLDALGPKVSIEVVGTQARLTFPRACFPSGYYRVGVRFSPEAGPPADANVNVHLCEKAECAQRSLSP